MPKPYTIQKGDTLSAIAAANKTDVQTLAKLNKIPDPNLIREGATLNLPDAPPPASSIADRFSAPPGIATSDPIRNEEAKKTAEQFEQDKKNQEELARLTTQKQIQDLRGSLVPEGGAPTRPDLLGTFNTLRSSQGITAVEDEIAGLRKRRLELKTQFDQYQEKEHGRGGVVSRIVSGKINEEGRKIQEDLDQLDIEEQLAVDRLNSKNKYIETVMKLTGDDYQNATARFDKDFSRNIQLQGQLSQEQNRERDDARAYLTTVSNFVQTSGKAFDDLDPGMRAEIQRRELQAGFVPGTLEAFVRMKPKANLLGSKEGTDAKGNAVMSFIYADENGNPGVVRTVPLGIKPSSSGDTNAETFDRIKLEAAQLFEADRQRNEDKKVSPEVYGAARAKVPAQYRDDFDRAFADLLSAQTKRQFAISSKESLDDVLNRFMAAGAAK